jgi:hypothetical protein
MGICFVRPETAVLTLANGDTLIVRKRLTCGEQRDQFSRSYEWVEGTDERSGFWRHNISETGVALVTAYLVDWRSVTGEADSIRGLSIQELTKVLRDLAPASFREIKLAIEAHEAAMDAEREAEKNGQGGEPNAPAISPSPFAAVGASSGSAN